MKSVVSFEGSGEFDFIERIKSLCNGSTPACLVTGIGDDCAAFVPAPGFLQIVTTDSMVEGVHFRFESSTLYSVGKKALAVNLSDIAAMGGIPRYALISLQIPAGYGLREAEELYKGVLESAGRDEVTIIGGNIASSALFSIHITMTGEVEQECMVRRGTMKPGDAIYVTGTLGDSSAGCELVNGSDRTPGSDDRDTLMARHKEPQPRVREGRLLAKNSAASAMIDVSDGIASDLRRMCENSAAGAVIYKERLPVSRELAGYAADRRKDPGDYALYGGEDYELLFTVAPGMEERVRRIMKEVDTPCTRIGEMTDSGTMILVDGKGCSRPLENRGFDHLVTPHPAQR